MKLFIAGIFDSLTINKENIELFMDCDFNLQTFYSIKGKEKVIDDFIKYKGQDNFMLDSGAFSMFSGSEKNLSYNYLKKYIDMYCDYINVYKIDNFIEMDIDRIIGYEKVKMMREYINNKVNKKAIEVWHPWRGLEDFDRACKENDWICVSIKQKTGKKDTFQYFIDRAHGFGTKVHILGYTPLYLEKFRNLYSCDSTSWSGGGRWANIHIFNGNEMQQIKKPDNVRRVEDTDVYSKLNQHNLRQWIKYQKYLKDKGWIV